MSAAETWSWTGKTQAGRELRLSGPPRVITTATLDGEPIAFVRGHHGGGRGLGEGYVVRSDAGTFTAIAEGSDPDLHSVLLKTFVNAAPEGGWVLTPVSERVVDDEHRFAFEVSNDWRTATLELYLSESAARIWLERGGGRTLQEMAAQQLAKEISRSDWPAIQQRADKGPKTIMFSAHPPDRY